MSRGKGSRPPSNPRVHVPHHDMSTLHDPSVSSTTLIRHTFSIQTSDPTSRDIGPPIRDGTKRVSISHSVTGHFGLMSHLQHLFTFLGGFPQNPVYS